MKSKSICIAYETVTDDNGRLPLLAPMSAVAGRMSVQAGAHALEKNQKVILFLNRFHNVFIFSVVFFVF